MNLEYLQSDKKLYQHFSDYINAVKRIEKYRKKSQTDNQPNLMEILNANENFNLCAEKLRHYVIDKYKISDNEFNSLINNFCEAVNNKN